MIARATPGTVDNLRTLTGVPEPAADGNICVEWQIELDYSPTSLTLDPENWRRIQLA